MTRELQLEEEFISHYKTCLGIDGPLDENSMLNAIHELNTPYHSLSEKRRKVTESVFSLLNLTDDTVWKKHVRPRAVGTESTKTLGINVSGPVDIALQWSRSKNMSLNLIAAYCTSGGGQVNISQIFASEDVPIDIVCPFGSQNHPISLSWLNGLPNEPARYVFSESNVSPHVNIYNFIDGLALEPIVGMTAKMSDQSILALISKIEEMTNEKAYSWVLLTIGGAVQYNETLDMYGKILKVFENRPTNIMVDFKYTATEREILTTLNSLPKGCQTYITPNEVELALICKTIPNVKIEQDSLSKKPEVSAMSKMLLDRFKISGVLVTLGRNGLLFNDGINEHQLKDSGVEEKNSVGAGDAARAGWCLAMLSGLTPSDALNKAAWFGGRAVSLPHCGVVP